MTVRELLDRIDSREMSEWMAYYRIEPFGEMRADLRQQSICATIANANRGKRGRRFKLKHFDLFPESRGETDIERQQTMLKGLTVAMGGRVL